ncbi:hypothetical protein TYRP_000169 [Tyrophagus putrescentiae]|nr:hypothetical protein TYRP_000169 [Tyrophagus putrescentiae]
MYGSGAQIKTARSGVTWLNKNARRRGPRERSERGPSRRAFLVSQVTPGIDWCHLVDRHQPTARDTTRKLVVPRAVGADQPNDTSLQHLGSTRYN